MYCGDFFKKFKIKINFSKNKIFKNFQTTFKEFSKKFYKIFQKDFYKTSNFFFCNTLNFVKKKIFKKSSNFLIDVLIERLQRIFNST